MSIVDLPNAILGAAAGFVLQGIGFAFVAVRQYTRQEFSGKIYEIIPASGGKGERSDIMHMRQAGQRLKGSVKRVSPDEERGRRWKIIGYIHGNIVVSVFYPTDPRKDSSSYGVMVMHRHTEIKDTSVWHGYYVRPDLHGQDSVTNAEIARYQLVWQKVSPEIKNYSTSMPSLKKSP